MNKTKRDFLPGCLCVEIIQDSFLTEIPQIIISIVVSCNKKKKKILKD